MGDGTTTMALVLMGASSVMSLVGRLRTTNRESLASQMYHPLGKIKELKNLSAFAGSKTLSLLYTSMTFIRLPVR